MREAARYAEHARGLGADAREGLGKAELASLAPLERQRQQQLQAGRAGLGLRERQVLAVVVHRRVVRARAVDGAVLEPARERVAVALAPQRRIEPAVGIEVADVAL